MFKGLSIVLSFGAVFSLCSEAQGTPSLIKLSSSDRFQTLALEDGAAIPKSGLFREMALAKRASQSGDKATCLKSARKVGRQAPGVAHWANIIELKCAMMGTPRVGDLNLALERIRKNPRWLLSAHFAKEIRAPFLEGLVHLATHYAKSERSKAWVAINEAFSHKEWMSADQEAELYALAGEMSFVEQNLSASLDYFEKSLQIKDTAKMKDRITSIKLAMSPKGEAGVKSNELDFVRGRTATAEEAKIYARMTQALAAKDLLSALEDGIQLLVKFPEGDHSAEVERQVSGIFIGMATGSEANWNQLKSRVLRSLKKAPGDRLLKWARLSFSRGKYREAFEIAESAAGKLAGQTVSGEAISIQAQAAQSSGELNLAIKAYRDLVERFSGASYYFDSLFRLGLSNYRKGSYSEAVAAFEKLLSSQGGENYEYRALYWTWRSLQNLKMDRAKSLQDLLIQKYPMTLYGMRALAEKSEDQIIKLSEKKRTGPVRVNLRLLPDQKLSWDRFGVLIKGGWLEEAQRELKNLPQPRTAEEHLIYAKLFSAARGFVDATQLMNKAWELNPEFAYNRDFLTWIFPQTAFQKEIKKWSERRNLEPVWVKSLIRQESAYNPRAVSRSNALGLMQLLPATAQEMAGDLKKPTLQIPDSLFDSEMNIELGTIYVRRMLTRYKEQLPFALAAYNAGPTRFSRWLQSAGVEVGNEELWVEELPWSETSHYVKAILRNILIFQILDQGQLKMNSPIWQISPEKS